MRIDAHQHFWRYNSDEFGWIDDAMSAIRRDFLPGDLRPLLASSGIDATIAVQARQSMEETTWLLELASGNDWIAGVVGWVPLIAPDVASVLETLAANPRLKGVRHVLQAEPSEYMLREDFNRGIAHLRQFNLAYDLLILEHQLPVASQFVDLHPNQPIILDHLAKPRIASHELEPWRTNIRELARRPNVACKISGMVTEADYRNWTVEELRPYFETALEAFGPGRLLFGSDWPVCTVASTYTGWVSAIDGFICQLSGDEQQSICGRNAARIYRLDGPSNSTEGE